MEFFGLKPEDAPTVRLINLADNMAKYKPEDSAITAAVLSKFASDFTSGALKVPVCQRETHCFLAFARL
jgi:protein disulfide-isomerase A1